LRSALAPPTLSGGRRRSSVSARLVAVLIACAVAGPAAPDAQARRYTIAFANLTEEPAVTLEGTGFTGREVRESFVLAARLLPVDLVLYDNRRDPNAALDNAADAIRRKVDLYIQYHHDATTNAAIGARLHAANIPVIAINYPVPGAPLYTADNVAAGRIAGDALGEFAAGAWRGRPVLAVVLGNVGARDDHVPERVRGVIEGLTRHQPAIKIVTLDTQGNAARVGELLGRLLANQPGKKLLIAAMDDGSALAAKGALEAAGRLADGAIASHGVDRSIHGGMSDRKEIDPSNRGSIVIGSVAFYLDRYGYDVLPLALRMLRGEPVPPRAVTRHKLITAANVFVEYPPYDMQ
jgi:ribose transport system substrate-binding protein